MSELTCTLEGGRAPDRYKNDPVLFCREVLKFEPYPKQVAICESVRDNEKTAVACSYSVGMSWISSALAVWAMYCRDEVVSITSPARRILLRYISQFHEMAAERLGGALTTSKGDWGPRAFSIEEHLDTAREERYERWCGMDSLRRLRIGRPRLARGTLYDAFHQREPEWNPIHINAFDTPNLNGEDVPGLVTAEWVNHILKRHGGASRVFKQDVLAEFPTAPRPATATQKPRNDV